MREKTRLNGTIPINSNQVISVSYLLYPIDSMAFGNQAEDLDMSASFASKENLEKMSTA
jgi:hypothetical protein